MAPRHCAESSVADEEEEDAWLTDDSPLDAQAVLATWQWLDGRMDRQLSDMAVSVRDEPERRDV